MDETSTEKMETEHINYDTYENFIPITLADILLTKFFSLLLM